MSPGKEMWDGLLPETLSGFLTALGMIWEAGVRGDLSQDSSSQALWGWGTRRVGARVTASRQSMPGYRCVWWVSDVYLRGQRNPSPAL